MTIHAVGTATPRRLFTNKALLTVGLTLFFFHLGNAALLPLLGQSAVARFEVNAAVYTAGTVILAQATMILTALWGAHTAERKGYGRLFFLALLALPLRGTGAPCHTDTPPAGLAPGPANGSCPLTRCAAALVYTVLKRSEQQGGYDLLMPPAAARLISPSR